MPRVCGMDPATFFRDHWCSLRAVILEVLVDLWPAMARWRIDHFRTLGKPEVEVRAGRASDPDDETTAPACRARMRWHAFLDLVAQDPGTSVIRMTATTAR